MQIVMSIRDQKGFPVWTIQSMRREACDTKHYLQLQNYTQDVYATLVQISRYQRALTEEMRNGSGRCFASFAQLMLYVLKEMVGEHDAACPKEQKSLGVFEKIREKFHTSKTNEERKANQ